jgi:hypothetical protein
MLNGMSSTKILKFFAGKLCTIIRENSVQYAKMQYNDPQKFDCIIFGYPAYRLGFNPFCESINRYNQKSIATLSPWKRTQDVDAPCGKWPRQRDPIERLSRLVNLPFKKVTSFTCPNQLSGIFERCRPVKPLSKGFPDQRFVRGMGPIDSSVDVMEQTNALGLGDTLEKNPNSSLLIGGTKSI